MLQLHLGDQPFCCLLRCACIRGLTTTGLYPHIGLNIVTYLHWLIFQILRFMNDPHLSGLREKIIADYVVQMGLSHNSLRDEIYAQICNQTWLNRNAANNERGWYLMSHCLSAFPPSRALAKYLVKWVMMISFWFICSPQYVAMGIAKKACNARRTERLAYECLTLEAFMGRN